MISSLRGLAIAGLWLGTGALCLPQPPHTNTEPGFTKPGHTLPIEPTRVDPEFPHPKVTTSELTKFRSASFVLC